MLYSGGALLPQNDLAWYTHYSTCVRYSVAYVHVYTHIMRLLFIVVLSVCFYSQCFCILLIISCAWNSNYNYTVYNINSNYMYMYYAHVHVLHVADILNAYCTCTTIHWVCITIIIIIIIL